MLSSRTLVALLMLARHGLNLIVHGSNLHLTFLFAGRVICVPATGTLPALHPN